MILFETYVINNLYVILLLMALLTMLLHNGLIWDNKQNPFKYPDIRLTFKEQVWFFVSLFVGTIIVMFFAIYALPFKLEDKIEGLIVIGIASITSFLIIQILNSLLGTMKEDKLSIKFLWHWQFLLVICLIIFTELSFLNWIKEITIYTQKPFLKFLMLYSILILGISFFLGEKVFPKQWRWRFIILIDPLVIIFSSWVLLKITLDFILLVIR